MDVKAIESWCATGALPEDQEFYGAFVRGDKLFDDVEGRHWDFKDQWPFSLSDEYFGGIARLICAFGNSYGGIIVFGVHDKKRDGGHNKVNINFDRFCKAIDQLLGGLPSMQLRSYQSREFGNIDALLVSPRAEGVAPFRFQRAVGKYRADVIWSRVGHEVIAAEPAQFPVLFCRDRSTDGDRSLLDGSIPPSPATLKHKFVGRVEVLDRLFHWLETSDEPRTYLHGKGGSGKTTIAYEFARLVMEHGSTLRINGTDPVDSVIFLSAKEKSLLEGKIVQNENVDFTNEKELLSSILHWGGWSNNKNEEATVEQLRKYIVDLLDIISFVIVIDDVDTLTTKGVDPGSDFLYRTLCRSRKNSKVIYTIRNAPSQSLSNAIEVPGLSTNEYDQFVTECVAQFSVPTPDLEFREKRLPILSERRPLVIENIIALRRTSGSYERATELFQQHAGEAVRDYVFLREWDALAAGTPKLLLAALSEFSAPASFQDLQSVLQFDQSAVSDAIGAVREMFLEVDEAGRDTLYALAPLTKSFVLGKRSLLVGYNTLRERVKAYQRVSVASNPRVASLATVVERLLPSRYRTHIQDKVQEAFRLVSDRNLPASVTEDPVYRSILGYVLCCFAQPRLTEAREAFNYALSMNLEPDFRYLKAWHNAEQSSGVNDGWSMRVADVVLEGKRYGERDKREMIGQKAKGLFARAQERTATDPTEAMKDFSEALRLHLRAFRLCVLSSDFAADIIERYARGTGFSLANMVSRSSTPWEFFDILDQLCRQKDIHLDPILDPIIYSLQEFLQRPHPPESSARMRNRLRGFAHTAASNELWLSRSVQEAVLKRIANVEAQIESRSTRRQASR
ncbi:RNA-binding domain-containing protein [Devosia neptuniae]|uniref:RNA-binding domain-containing protein n=1 Tax=Devosia neptuniae TaxID=191302 RepID=UPI0022B04F79|nr:RNA-binding domain-containing protein [Devosia neptuniae]MCZ4346441.1 putative DNA binding domain-containing protein [Devosia neptuniae]